MNKNFSIPAIIATGAIGLAGTVPQAWADQQMEARDKTVGESVRDGLEYAEAKTRDAWLDGKLESALLFNEHLNSFDIDTTVANGNARLSGAVESDIDRDLAGEIAQSIDGIDSVENDLVVDEQRVVKSGNEPAAASDRSFKKNVLNATLTARVKTQLVVNGNTGGLAINVDSDDGVVTLSGKVKSAQEKELAGRIASNTPGTDSIQNDLTVAPEEEAE